MNFILIKSQGLQVLTIYPVNILNCQASLLHVLTLPGNIWKSDIRSFLNDQTSLSNSIISLHVSRNTECLGLWEPIYLGIFLRKEESWGTLCIVHWKWPEKLEEVAEDIFSVWMRKRGGRRKMTVSKCLALTLTHKLDFMILSKGIGYNLRASMSFSISQTWLLFS